MKKIYTVLLILICSSFMLMGMTFQHKNGGVSIWFPDNWKVTTEEGMLEATSPDQEAYVHMLVLQDVESLDVAVDAYTTQLDQVVKEFTSRSEEALEVEVNGLKLYVIEGEGKVDGVTLDVGIALIESNSAVTMMITFNSKNAAEKYKTEFEQIVQSIKAI